uniref:Uncharacterized protein n=1 Tax=Oscillatoriales cyanobacterium SpSt-402 TaxID=2282168 RepID=A0A832H4K2_9CYAN
MRILAYEEVGVGEGASCGGLALGAQALVKRVKLRAMAHIIQVRFIGIPSECTIKFAQRDQVADSAKSPFQ